MQNMKCIITKPDVKSTHFYDTALLYNGMVTTDNKINLRQIIFITLQLAKFMKQ